ncbi:hypothetical protein XSR1_360010 [Xenorhabdus szentirmaii DSM 16338]|uniref:Uncharacterized protein n=1 Tax=Xenorhabdus szentirmaii DSM 16338 TaxID=1427518 RepID=W1J1H0_9GAMM|nr:hypothetical protein XSR1_360010 [Xenorhabdus szentirmaii DSM 16338]
MGASMHIIDDELIDYPYFLEKLTVTGSGFMGTGIHIIDDMRVRP